MLRFSDSCENLPLVLQYLNSTVEYYNRGIESCQVVEEKIWLQMKNFKVVVAYLYPRQRAGEHRLSSP
jgi:hypothetical protein